MIFKSNHSTGLSFGMAYGHLRQATLLLLIGLLLCILACDPNKKSEEETGVLLTRVMPTESGILMKNTITEDIKHNHLLNDMIVAGAGVAIGDLNKDGLADIFFAGNQVDDALYLNRGELRFEDASQKASILPDGLWSAGVTMADVNNDGWLDIYVCRSVQENQQLSGNLLYINRGFTDSDSFYVRFEEQAGAYGLADRGFSVQASFLDFNKDGFLDVYIVNQPPSLGKRTGGLYNRLKISTAKYTDRLYVNLGNGSFEDATSPAGVLNLGYGLSASVADFNDDGWPDIYVTNDFDRPDHLYMNQTDGTFRNVINSAVKHISNFSMGSDAADYDNDGLIDVLAVDMVAEDHKRIKTFMGGMRPEYFWQIVNNGWHYQYMFNTLQKNNGNGTFSEVAHLANVSNTDWSWGPVFCDLDNDGWKDLYVTNGIKRNQRHSDMNARIERRLDSLEVIAKQKGKTLNDVIDVMEFVEMAPIDALEDHIYRNDGDLTFSNMRHQWLDSEKTISHGVAYADLDNDGDLELVIHTVDDHPILLKNNTRERTGGNYLRVEVLSDAGAPMLQARVSIRTGDTDQLIEVSNARSYMSKSEDIAHFGLGEVDMVDELTVTFPSGHTYVQSDVPTNQIIRVSEAMAADTRPLKDSEQHLFREMALSDDLAFRHRENDYNDFKKEVLLPHKMSRFGPALAAADVNGDGLEDFFVGGAHRQAGRFYIQKAGGRFEVLPSDALTADALHEDVGARFVDGDGDGDMDLYVASGGNEFEVDDDLLIDRYYRNNGKGRFSRSNDIPIVRTSGSQVVAGDYDGDGDPDLFVGGRLVPGHYPVPAKSTILKNDNGRFEDVTDALFPNGGRFGLVTDGTWSDMDADGDLDLIIVGEWMPVQIWMNDGDVFTDRTLDYLPDDLTGWYYSIHAEDMDGDGDTDLLAGNLGLNYKYKASEDEPFVVYSEDFDQNGRRDIILAYHEHGAAYPVRGRSCSSEQMPHLEQKFPTFESFGDADVFDVYTKEALDSSMHFRATNFASLYLENTGRGSLNVRPLPNAAQVSSVNQFLVDDYDGDGHKDVLVAGNLYHAEIETPRNDAGMGLFLKGRGSGDFDALGVQQSGFFAPHDVKGMVQIRIGRGSGKAIVVANNDYWLQMIAVRDAVQ